MKIKAFWLALCTAFIFCACDESTSTLGIELVPESDMVSIGNSTFNVTLNTITVDSVLARTSTSQIGNYTDPETGTTIHSDYLMQLNNGTGDQFPERVVDDKSTKVELKLYFYNFVGDTLAPCRVSIYPLNKVMDNTKAYYTNVDPTDFYDTSAKPLATATFTLSDRTKTDSQRYESADRSIQIKLPNQIGDDIISKYKSNPEYFANGKIFNEKVNQGYFVKFERGEGVMIDIFASQLLIHFNHIMKSKSGNDSIASGVTTYAGTEEVIQATAVTKHRMETLIDDPEATYVKTPAGLFTEVTLPIKEMAINDTINSAKLIFERFNAKETGASYTLPAPKYLLMVEKSKMHSFFEKNCLPDNDTSYTATFSSKDNNYTYENISHIISYMRKMYKDGIASDKDWESKNPDWNKVVLIPVEPIFNSSNSSSNMNYYSYYYGYGQSQQPQTIIALNHDLSMTSARLKKNGVTLQVIYSRFNQ